MVKSGVEPLAFLLTHRLPFVKSLLATKYPYMKDLFSKVSIILLPIISFSCSVTKEHLPLAYVNPYMGNISHLLVPTYPTIHLPNSMLRVYPERADHTSDQLRGLPLMITSHRGRSAFSLSPVQGQHEPGLKAVQEFTYDNEVIKPYYYEVTLDEKQTHIRFAPSSQSALYSIMFSRKEPAYLVFNTRRGKVSVEGNQIAGWQPLENNTTVYFYGETDVQPLKSGILDTGTGIRQKSPVGEGRPETAALYFGDGAVEVKLRYGISFISTDQAKKNLQREIQDFDLQSLSARGRAIWDETLGSIQVEGTNSADKAVFYTSLYRCYERPVNISEDGRYFSAFDGKVHDDYGTPFFTDDWIWDTYRATHPLRILTDPKKESDILNSFIRMAEQMDHFWMPTFPEITGDSRRMNSNHGIISMADAWAKGIKTFDLEKAYNAGKNAIQQKTLAPWSAAPSGWIDDFYKKHGYIPALAPGEKETVPEVHPFEKRQPVAVTLGTSYDEWALGRIARFLGKEEDEAYFSKQAVNYRNLFNPNTAFFHPKDKDGKFITPFDYRYSGGMGARDYYGENNAWLYRWDVPHNIADLITLMGGTERFNANLDQTFREPLGKSKFDFFSQLPDHTGNVGQFSMANEPALHVPYLYNYSGKPALTQKRIHTLIDQWFRNDLMGLPGDEDGGGMSAFVVFSMMGFYPVTPGLPVYTIGSPFFERATIVLGNGKNFTVVAKNYSQDHKYIQAARLNGEIWNKPWFSHADLEEGGILELTMGKNPNDQWGSSPAVVPPSFN